MNKIIQLLLGSMAISLLAGCLSTEDQNVENVSITSPSELYGAWRFTNTDLDVDGGGQGGPDFYYVFGAQKSYFIWASTYDRVGLFRPFELASWTLKDGKAVSIQPNFGRLISDIHIGLYPIKYKNWFDGTYNSQVIDEQTAPGEYRNQMKGFDSVSVYTVSSVDSIIMACHILDSISLENNSYNSIDSPDSTSFVIIQFLRDSKDLKRGYEEIHTVSAACYNLHEGATNMKDLCYVTVLRKEDGFDLTGLLSKVDTLSSTAVWQDLKLQ